MATKWNVTFVVHRQKGTDRPHFDRFTVEVDPDEYVLDGVERIWAFHDRSLCFRHACHHSTCGACGMRVNGTEKLTCITPIHTMTRDGGALKLEPLRNFPVISDLVVDMGLLYRRTELAGQQAVVSLADEPARPGIGRSRDEQDKQYVRLSDCIECGLCVSACPILLTTPEYLTPAGLAAIHQNGLDRRPDLFSWVDSENGVWRCHSAFECSAVCPSFVDPGARIMDLRKQVIVERIKRLFGGKRQPTGQGVTR